MFDYPKPPPRLPKPLPPPLPSSELSTRVPTNASQTETEPQPPSTTTGEIPEDLQTELDQIIYDNTIFKQNPTTIANSLQPKVLVKKGIIH